MKSEEISRELIAGGVSVLEQVLAFSDAEVDALERTAGVHFPAAYRVFLRAVGKRAHGYFDGTRIFGTQIAELNEAAAALLRENEETFALPADAFVFSMHQGYQFHYLLTSDGDDPPIYFYSEGCGPPEQVFASFSEFVRESIRWHVESAAARGAG